MATSRVTASNVVQSLFTTPKHIKGKLSAVNIDNQSGAARTIQIQDVFTPDASAGTPGPLAQTRYRLQVTVPGTASLSFDEKSLKDIECLGAVGALADAVAAACVIVVNYHFS